MRDPRSEPAIRKALEEFTKQAPTNKDDQDVKWAARGTGALRLASLSEPLFLAFMKLQASTMLGGITYRDMSDALGGHLPVELILYFNRPTQEA